MADATVDTGFPQRLRMLINAHHASVRAAAKALGLTHPGLLALLAGSSSPRTSTLNRIVAHYQVSRDWLMAGEGKGPASAPSSSTALPRGDVWEQWRDLVCGLPVSRDAKTALVLSPMLVDVLHALVLPAIERHGRQAGLDRDEALLMAFSGDVRAALEEESSAWLRLFRRWMEVASTDEVGRAIEANLQRFLQRFGPMDPDGLPWNLIAASFSDAPESASTATIIGAGGRRGSGHRKPTTAKKRRR
jgi:hypothetical protein